MKALYTLFICYLFNSTSLWGQEETRPIKNLIPTPNSCALVQYADFPVS